MHPSLRFAIITVIFAVTACGKGPELPRLNNNATILAFGNSLTEGTGATEDQSYPAVLAELSGRKVINAGISGELSSQGLNRLPELLEKHRPDLLILCHGGNDILRQQDMQQTANNIRRMIQLANRKDVPVILLGVPKPGLFLSSADIYSKIADSTEVIFMEDLIPDILGDKLLKSDTVHPNAEGYRRMAESIYTLLRESGAV